MSNSFPALTGDSVHTIGSLCDLYHHRSLFTVRSVKKRETTACERSHQQFSSFERRLCENNRCPLSLCSPDDPGDHCFSWSLTGLTSGRAGQRKTQWKNETEVEGPRRQPQGTKDDGVHRVT